MEEITLEKIDIIRQRFGVSYEEAKSALEENDGDLVNTLIQMERNKKGFSESARDKGNDLLDTIKDIIEKGNVNRIKVKKGRKVLVDIPVSAGVAAGAISLVYMPILAIGAVTAIVADLKIEIERPNGEVEILNTIVKEKSSELKDKIKDLGKSAKEKAGIVRDKAEDIVHSAREKGDDLMDEVEDEMIEIKSDLKEAKEDLKEDIEDIKEEVKEKLDKKDE